MWGYPRDRTLFTCGACLPRQVSLYLPRWGSQNCEQKCRSRGWSLDGWVERFLLCHESRLEHEPNWKTNQSCKKVQLTLLEFVTLISLPSWNSFCVLLLTFYNSCHFDVYLISTRIAIFSHLLSLSLWFRAVFLLTLTKIWETNFSLMSILES